MAVGAPRRVWIAAAAAGAAGVALTAVLFRVSFPPAGSGARAPSRPSVGLVGAADQGVRQETELLDPAPLFLPTRWNSTQKSVRRPEPDPMQPYPPKLSGELRSSFPAPAGVPERTEQLLSSDPEGRPFRGFGRGSADVAPLSARRAFVEIVAVGTGLPVLQIALRDAAPPSPPGSWWRPPEFLAAVDAAGLIGPLVLTVRSGAGEVDEYFRVTLEQTLRVGDRLRPGIYRICVGP